MPSLLSKLADPFFQGRVRPVTFNRYRAAMLAFTTWAMEEQSLPVSADDWDDLLLEYRWATARLTKSKFMLVVAATEFFLPHAKRNLPWCHAIIQGWSRIGHTRHTVPLTVKPVQLVAVYMVATGFRRLALGLLVQVSTVLRPSEMLSIRPCNVQFAKNIGEDPKIHPVVIALGVKAGTKSKRAQVVMIPANTHCIGGSVAEMCGSHTERLLLISGYVGDISRGVEGGGASVGLGGRLVTAFSTSGLRYAGAH